MYLTFNELAEIAKKKDFKLEEPIFTTFTTDLTLDEESDNYKEDLIPFRCLAYHDLNNANGSRINPDVFIDKTRSIEYRPILANVVKDENGELDFGAHDFHIEEDENGNPKQVFDEKAIGVVTNYGFIEDPIQNVTRAMVTGYLFGRYAEDAISIMRKKKRCHCSVELQIRDMHYDTDDQRLVLDDYVVSGVTVLGSKYSPGMVGSEIALQEFVKENKLVTFQHLSEEECSQLFKEVCDFFSSDTPRKKVEDEPVSKPEEVVEESPQGQPQEPPQEDLEGSDGSEDTSDETESLQAELNALKEENRDLKYEIEVLKVRLEGYIAQDLKKAKEEVLADPVYQPYLSTSEFKDLVEDAQNLSLDKFKIQAELAFAKCERQKILSSIPKEFSQTQVGTATKKLVGVPKDKAKESRYGNIFSEGGK